MTFMKKMSIVEYHRLAMLAHDDPDYLAAAEEIDAEISRLEARIQTLHQQKMDRFKEAMDRVYESERRKNKWEQ